MKHRKIKEYFVNFNVNEEVNVEAYFTNDYKKNFVDGEAIMVQLGIIDENNKITWYEKKLPTFIDKNGSYYWYRDGFILKNTTYTQYSFGYLSPSFTVYQKVFNYSFINSLFE